MNFPDWIDVEMDDGARLRVGCGGRESGPLLVFLAGWLSVPRGWTEVLDVLAQDYRILYCESREKASSTLDSGRHRDFSVARMRADLAALVAALVPAGAAYDLAGSSLGATVILEYLVDCPRPPQRVALIAPNREYRFPPWLRFVLPLLPLWIYPAFREYIKFHLRHFRLDPKAEPEQYAKYCETLDLADPAKLKPNARSLMDYRMSDRIGEIAVECLILGGEADRLHGLAELRGLAAAIPRAGLLAMASNRETHSHKAGLAMLDFLRGGLAAVPVEPSQNPSTSHSDSPGT